MFHLLEILAAAGAIGGVIHLLRWGWRELGEIEKLRGPRNGM